MNFLGVEKCGMKDPMNRKIFLFITVAEIFRQLTPLKIEQMRICVFMWRKEDSIQAIIISKKCTNIFLFVFYFYFSLFIHSLQLLLLWQELNGNNISHLWHIQRQYGIKYTINSCNIFSSPSHLALVTNKRKTPWTRAARLINSEISWSVYNSSHRVIWHKNSF